MSTAVDQTQNDLLGVTAFFSVLLHTVIILGISFKLPEIAARDNTDHTLDVVLVNSANQREVEDAEFNSKFDNEGGGTDDKDGSTPLPWKAVNPSPIQSVKKVAKQVNATTIAPDQLIMAKTGEISVSKPATAQTELKLTTPTNGQDKINANQRQLEKERLLAKINRIQEEYNKRPKREFLGPNSKGLGAAEYLDSWKQRVERLGNVNYPTQLRARELSGTVIATVEVNRNGTVHRIIINNPSPHKLLNDYTQRILRDASPYQVFPEEDFFEKIDILVVTRAFIFKENRVESRASKPRLIE